MHDASRAVSIAKLVRRVTAGATVLVILLLATASVAIVNVSRIDHTYQARSHLEEAVTKAGVITQQQQLQRALQAQFALTGDAQVLAQFDTAAERTFATMDEIEAEFAGDAAITGFAAQARAADIGHDTTVHDKLAPAVAAGRTEDVKAALTEANAALDKIFTSTDAINDEVVAKAAELDHQVAQRVKRTQQFIIICTVLAGGGGVACSGMVMSTLRSTLRRLGTQLSRSIGTVSERGSDINAAADVTAGEASEVADAAREVSDSVASAAVALQELQQAIQEIAHHASDATVVAANAVDAASTASEVINKLESSSTDIGAVITAIEDLAAQTNLLALNATIEAARAGEAGKGFAVVATEVKALATQTSDSTSEIAQRLAAIQDDSRLAIRAIEAITSVIDQVAMFQSGIAAAVEEQTATSAEVARTVTTVSAYSVGIAERIARVAEAAEAAKRDAIETVAATKDLRDIESDIGSLVGIGGTGGSGR